METSITPEILEEFKERMHFTHNSEDSNLKRLLSFSYTRIQNSCGPFDISLNQSGKEIVFERTRYAYNDAVEYFEDNFISEINALALSLLPNEEGDADEEV
ncbi:phage gp6-like head-tail connector protein [Rossellomorea marisflavi]|uniref:phage gp6-like head-tail connector protein n=1 Tax=Rossellomorea marisflavi TaxID=189381 RepID=UPI0039BF47F3